MQISTPKTLACAALVAVCAMLAVPFGTAGATTAGAVLTPGVLTGGIFSPLAVQKVQYRRRAREGRRIVRRDRRGVRRGRRLFKHKDQRYRGSYLAVPRVATPYYAYGTTPYADYPAYYDPYFDNTQDYTPTPAPRGGSCTGWRQRCEANWGGGNANFWGCMRFHGCN